MRSPGPRLAPIEALRFGVVTARWEDAQAAELPQALAFCNEHGVELLVARCDTGDPSAAHALERAGGLLMDTLVHLSTTPGTPETLAAPCGEAVIRSAGPEDAASVAEIAAEAFREYGGHYHADPRLDREAVEAVYPDWASRSCREEAAADAVFVALRERRMAGFLTLRHRGGEEAEIPLCAVHPAAQRRGVHGALTATALGWSAGQGKRRLHVATQAHNVASQGAWIKAGFRPARAQHTFHLWRS